jgi:colanic acid biosynthesis glycosyl transferase WcaI
MKILIYSANFAPEPTGVGKYSGDMAAWLAEQGHQVRVVAAPPYYPTWKRDPKYNWPPYRREKWHGVDIWRAPLWVPKAPGGLKRILHLLSFAITSFPVMVAQIFWHPELVVTVAPAFVCAPVGLLTGRLARSQCWLHIQDFEIDVAFQMGLLTSKLLQRVILRIERWLLFRFDSVSSISKRMVERLALKGVCDENTRYFPNWVDVASLTPKLSTGKFREELGIEPGQVVVLFSGSLGSKQGLMVIPETAVLLAGRKDIVFVICGDGVLKPSLELATASLPNMRLLPLQPVKRLGELLGMADIHLLTQSPDASDLVLPSKLSGMLVSGRPVIATCDSGTEIESVVKHCGLVVPPEDAPALSVAICRLADDPALRATLGRRARQWAEANFERDNVLGKIFGLPKKDEQARIHGLERAGSTSLSNVTDIGASVTVPNANIKEMRAVDAARIDGDGCVVASDAVA